MRLIYATDERSYRTQNQNAERQLFTESGRENHLRKRFQQPGTACEVKASSFTPPSIEDPAVEHSECM